MYILYKNMSEEVTIVVVSLFLFFTWRYASYCFTHDVAVTRYHVASVLLSTSMIIYHILYATEFILRIVIIFGVFCIWFQHEHIEFNM